jgi:hypothetical protein
VLFFGFCRFYFRRAFQDYPVQITGIIVSLGLLSAILASLVVIRRQTDEAVHNKQVLIQSRSAAKPLEKPFDPVVKLPEFNGASVVKSFNGIASDLHIPLDEILYSLDGNSRTPYLQYRIMLTTKAGYSDIRKFLAVLSSEMPNAALDAIRCARPDAAAATIGCELTFSAFFSKADHG